MLRALGSEVTLLVRKDSVLRHFDEYLQEGLLRALGEDGIQFVSRATPSALDSQQGRPGAQPTVDGRSHGPFDALIWAVGREPATD